MSTLGHAHPRTKLRPTVLQLRRIKKNFYFIIFFSYTGVKFLKDRVTEEKLIVHSDTAPRSVCQIRLNSQHGVALSAFELQNTSLRAEEFYSDLTSFKGVKTLNSSKYVSLNISEL